MKPRPSKHTVVLDGRGGGSCGALLETNSLEALVLDALLRLGDLQGDALSFEVLACCIGMLTCGQFGVDVVLSRCFNLLLQLGQLGDLDLLRIRIEQTKRLADEEEVGADHQQDEQILHKG